MNRDLSSTSGALRTRSPVPTLTAIAAATFALCLPAQQVLLDTASPVFPDSRELGRPVAADLDGDGDLDLVGRSHTLRNDGDGIFSVGVDVVPADFVLADFDGDGVIDRLGRQTTRLTLEFGLGNGAFGPAFPVLAGQYTVPELADLDGDGDPDALVGDGAGQAGYRWLRNDGPAGMTSVPLNLGPSPGTVRIGGDVDGDGDVDLLGFRSGATTDTLTVWANDGTAGFSPGPSRQVPQYLDLVATDVDRDGDPDILGRTRSARLVVLDNDGTGVFAPLPNAPVVGASNAAGMFVPLDADGDGDTDLLLVGGFYFENRGAQGFAMVRDNQLETALHGVAGDFDGDGDVDVATGTPTRAYLGDGTGRFASARRPLPLPQGALVAQVGLGDVDGDGLVDAVVVGTSVTTLSNDGSGAFPSAVPVVTLRSATLGDVDGDGDLDVVGWDHRPNSTASQTPLVWRNDGRGNFSFAPGAVTVLANLPTWELQLVDFDGDGDLDILQANEGPNALLRNDGAGRFVEDPGALPPEAFTTERLLPIDVDADGDLDLLARHRFLGAATYVNDGAGRFTRGATPITADIEAASDIDGDGDLDIVGSGAVWRNDGPLTFTIVPLPSGGTILAAADFDLDGDEDLLVRSNDRLDIVLNAGASGFQASVDRVGGAGRALTGPVRLADVDGDGDMDAFVGDDVLRGMARHVVYRRQPAVGKPLTMTLSGRAGELWALAWSPARAATTVPPRLRIGIDLAQASTAGLGTLDATGRAALTIAVPADPALMGFSAYWQAALIGQFATSNVETTTLTGL